MAKWAIKYGRTANYYAQMTGIGPAFGATRKSAVKFATKREAEAAINSFSIVASVMAVAVKVSP